MIGIRKRLGTIRDIGATQERKRAEVDVML
jgi:hypothetical protein